MSDVQIFVPPDVTDETRCARCGEPAAGYANINGVRYCHPDDPDAPDCYTLTLHGALPVGLSVGRSYTFNVSGEDLYPLREHIARCLEVIEERKP